MNIISTTGANQVYFMVALITDQAVQNVFLKTVTAQAPLEVRA